MKNEFEFGKFIHGEVLISNLLFRECEYVHNLILLNRY